MLVVKKPIFLYRKPVLHLLEFSPILLIHTPTLNYCISSKTKQYNEEPLKLCKMSIFA